MQHDINAQNLNNLVVRHCPICGSPDLEVLVLRSVFQQADGSWKFSDMFEVGEDLTSEVTNQNEEVRCSNQQCGAPYHLDERLPDNIDEMGLFRHWVLNFYTQEEHGDYYDPQVITFNDLPEASKEKYLDYESEVHYKPWVGVIADCI